MRVARSRPAAGSCRRPERIGSVSTPLLSVARPSVQGAMDADLTTGLIALAGVIVGGVLNGAVAMLLDRARIRADGRVGAILVAGELTGSVSAILNIKAEPKWGVLAADNAFGSDELWEENRVLLARALHPDAYMTLAAAYSGLKSAKSRAATEASDARIHDSHGVLATTYLTLCRGLTYLSPLMLSPSW